MWLRVQELDTTIDILYSLFYRDDVGSVDRCIFIHIGAWCNSSKRNSKFLGFRAERNAPANIKTCIKSEYIH